MPLRAGQFFEFWRKDNIGRFNKAEANVQNLRRTVELQFNQAGGNTGVTANVSTERLSLTEADVYGGHRAAGMYVTGGTSMQKLQLYEDSQKQWIPLETDQNLAGYVLWMIKNESDKHQEF
jgi:phage-related protein